MNSFVKNPHTPLAGVKCLAIGEGYVPILRTALSDLGVEVVGVPANLFVDSRLSSHADLSVLHLGENRFLMYEYLLRSAFAQKLQELGSELTFLPNPRSSAYPEDAALCALIMGESIYHHMDAAAAYGGRKAVRVRQGYAKCAVCPISETAAITADGGMCAALRGQEVEVLEVTQGHIGLKGFDFGFIGGSAFLLSASRLAFTGTLDGHPDKHAIELFLKAHGIEPVYLTRMPIFDIGSAILISEG